MGLYEDSQTIIRRCLERVQPKAAVQKALEGFEGKAYVAAIGKAAWEMAHACVEALPEQILGGVVITKHGHARGPIANLEIFEAGHPVPDEDTIKATARVLAMAAALRPEDQLIFLISGGGSALFEKPEEGLNLSDIEDVTKALLACGAGIVEINTIRKRLSAVKGGKFAHICAPAEIYAVILSDVVGDKVEFIASGPACADSSTRSDVQNILEKYGLEFSEKILACLQKETPKSVDNVRTEITGSVKVLCETGAEIADSLGYRPWILNTAMACEAAQAGAMIGGIAREVKVNRRLPLPCALIFGGETVVKVHGGGKGGRNQEIALAAAKEIDGLKDVLVFSLGSDGTDGPTDAAGGIVDGETAGKLRSQGMEIDRVLRENDSYHALKRVDALLMTGPTGTNVNDMTIILLK